LEGRGKRRDERKKRRDWEEGKGITFVSSISRWREVGERGGQMAVDMVLGAKVRDGVETI